jgi:MerR family transcriptional regulator, copper efflux regulator
LVGVATWLLLVSVVSFNSPPLDLRSGSNPYRAGVGSYTIGEVAERSGFTATALRYYEGIGLVPPAGRSDAGYRLYDDRTLSRLAFITRAKRLGCTLEEITDLVDVWDGDRCAPVQRRLHELVTAKLGDADRQITELSVFATELRATASQLAGEPVDGPCDDGCACLHDHRGTLTVALGSKPAEPAIACTLGAGEMRHRLAEWDRLLGQAVRRLALPSGGVRVEFDRTVDVGELARLVVAEQACCAFFRFAVTVDGRGVALEVDAPADALDLVVELFGTR